MSVDKYSYSSANIFPMKILFNEVILEECKNLSMVPSIHYQLNLTNKCNFDCEFCSCSKRDKTLELTLKDIEKIIEVGLEFGIQSVTITGGGEPLMHPYINEIIDMFSDNVIKIGIVTNGVLLHRLNNIDKITWIRISASDSLPVELKGIKSHVSAWLYNLHNVIKNNKTDWAFSYVLGDKPNYHLIKYLISFANLYKFTHVRIVNDILIAHRLIGQMKALKDHLLKKDYIDDSLVNYQVRSEWSRGFNPCYISLLKPVIGADRGIYPCCGTQYALDKPSRDYEKLMKMGTLDDLRDILYNQEFFNGSVCSKCYYGSYNNTLSVLLKGVNHVEFV